jgi:phage-related baseplate assembly protein
MALLTLASQLVVETTATIYAKALQVADQFGLDTSSWQPGNPTRSTFYVTSELLAELEQIVGSYVASGFLDHATGFWLKLLAKQVFNYDAAEATYATTTETLTNTGGGFYEIEAGDLTFRNTATGKTFHNTTGGTLASGPGTTLPLELVADEPGSDSSAAGGEIDDLVTTLLGVTVTNATAAVGIDEESEDSIREGCRAKLGSLSPNGPRDAYNFVAKNALLTGTSNVTRSRSVDDSDTGDVTLYLAGPSGPVLEADRALVETAILKWATPLTITPTVLSATGVTVNIAYQLWLYASVGETTTAIEDAVQAALAAVFRARPIGGDVITAPPGALFVTLVESTIRSVFATQAFRVNVTTPGGDTALLISQVAVLGTVTPTITLVDDP